MNAETLRRAAMTIRHDLEFGQECGDAGFLAAIADWLDDEAASCKSRISGLSFAPREHPLAVALAYLGDAA